MEGRLVWRTKLWNWGGLFTKMPQNCRNSGAQTAIRLFLVDFFTGFQDTGQVPRRVAHVGRPKLPRVTSARVNDGGTFDVQRFSERRIRCRDG